MDQEQRNAFKRAQVSKTTAPRANPPSTTPVTSTVKRVYELPASRTPSASPTTKPYVKTEVKAEPTCFRCGRIGHIAKVYPKTEQTEAGTKVAKEARLYELDIDEAYTIEVE